MQVMMLPFDSFKELRIGVYDGAHGEPIAPPLEEGDPKKGWYILSMDSAQCPTFRADDDEDEDEDEEDADKSTKEPLTIPSVDRAVFILWGLPRKGSVAAPAAAPEESPKAESKDAPKVEGPAKQETETKADPPEEAK